MKFNIKTFVSNNKAEIFTGIGIAAVLSGVFMACKNTMKLETVIEEHNKMREIIIEDCKKDETKNVKTETLKLYGYTGARLIGLYVLPAALVISGLWSCAHATKLTMDQNVTLAESNAALAAAAASSDDRFNKYRDRVIEKFGEEVDEQLLCPNGTYQEETEEVDAETGKKKKVKRSVPIVNPDADLSKYRCYLTRLNPNWDDNDDLMDYFFRCVNDAMNDELNMPRVDARPNWVTVNDCRARMAFDRRKDLQFDGWGKEYNDPEINKIVITWKKVFLPGSDGGFEPAYQVDFNAEPIYDLIV